MDSFKAVFYAGWGVMDSNAHMANTAYLDMSADTRMMYFKENGFPIGEFQRLGIGPVVRKDEIEYFREFVLLDEVRVELLLAGISGDGSRFRFRNVFRNAAGDTAAVVTTTAGWLDIRRRVLTAPPAELLALMNALGRTDDFEELPSSLNRAAAAPRAM